MTAAAALTGHHFRLANTGPVFDLMRGLLGGLGANVQQVSASAGADAGPVGSGAALTLSAHGLRGPLRDAPAHYSAVDALGGSHIAQYTYRRDAAYLIPQLPVVAQAALGTTALLAGRLHGRPPVPDISALRALLSIQTGHFVFGPVMDPGRWKLTPRGQQATYATYRCTDDWIFIGSSTHSFMIKTLQAAGLDDLLDNPLVLEGPRALRGTPVERELWDRLWEEMSKHDRAHWLAVFEQWKIPAGPVLSLEEAMVHPQIAAAGLAEPGATPWPLNRLVQVEPLVGSTPRARQAGPLPLSGVRVVELAGYIAGPYCGRLLRDLGAEVVKIEPVDGDPFRSLGYGFVTWNHGKKGLALDLRQPAAKQRLAGLIAQADIFLTNYKADALERMGFGRAAVLSLNPALVHVAISAFGESGPLAHLPGFDPVVQAFAGVQKRQGGDGEEPVKLQCPATDYLSGTLGAIGALAALVHQRQHGGGAVVRTSLLAAALLLNYDAYAAIAGGRPYPRGGVDFAGPHPLNALYQAQDGWVLTAQEQPFDEIAADVQALLDLAATMPADALVKHLTAAGVPALPSLHPEHLPSHPQHEANSNWMTLEQPELGVLTFPAPALGPATGLASPGLGQHNPDEDVALFAT